MRDLLIQIFFLGFSSHVILISDLMVPASDRG